MQINRRSGEPGIQPIDDLQNVIWGNETDKALRIAKVDGEGDVVRFAQEAIKTGKATIAVQFPR